jgi:hypothetical protein
VPQSINSIADKLTPAARAALLNAMQQMSEQVSIPALTKAIQQGNIGAALKAVKSVQFPKHLQPFAMVIGDVFQQAAKLTMQPFVQVDPAFIKKNPLAQAAADWSGQKITLINEQTRNAVRVLIRKGLTDGIEPKRLAKEIKPLIGLNARQAIAVQNARASWLQAGLDAASVDAKALQYTEKLRKYRALMIARTETIGASNRGQLHGWRRGAQNGLLDPATTKRKWIAAKGSGRTCDLCNAMHNSVISGLQETFTTPKGPLQHPPLHPNCRCTIGLVITPSTSRLPTSFNTPPPVPMAVPPPQAVMPQQSDYAKALVQQQLAMEAADAAKKLLKKQKAKEAQARFRAKKKLEREAAKLSTQAPESDFFSWEEYKRVDQVLQPTDYYASQEAIDAKINIMNALSDRMANSRATVRRSMWDSTGTYRTMDVPLRAMMKADRDEWVRERVSAWANTSGDHSAQSIAMQFAVREEFGLSSSDIAHFAKHTIEEAREILKYEVQAYREFAREMYNHTQDYFTKRGVTHITMVRGAKYPDGYVTLGWGQVQLQPISSFATHAKTATDFGNTLHIIRVPISQVLGSARTGFGCLNEHEFVLLGGQYRVWSLMGPHYELKQLAQQAEDIIKQGIPK